MPEIGDTVYIFEINHREYHRDEKGISTGGPIYRAHWRPLIIVGEEKRSWLVSSDGGTRYARKVAKNTVSTSDQVDADCWINNHRMHISEKVMRMSDAVVLKKIAELIGYNEQERN